MHIWLIYIYNWRTIRHHLLHWIQILCVVKERRHIWSPTLHIWIYILKTFWISLHVLISTIVALRHHLSVRIILGKSIRELHIVEWLRLYRWRKWLWSSGRIIYLRKSGFVSWWRSLLWRLLEFLIILVEICGINTLDLLALLIILRLIILNICSLIKIRI